MGWLKKIAKGVGKGAKELYGNAKGVLGLNAGKESKELVKAQEESQRALDQEARQSNYEYGEMAADSAHDRSLGLLEATTQANSLESKVADAKAAGLSPGLVLGAGGGSGGSAGGGALGTGTRGPAGQAPSYLEIAAVKEQNRANRIERARAAAEGAVAYAEAKKIKAETKNIEENTSTSKELTPLQSELLKSQAVSQWIENVRRDWENRDNKGRDVKGIEYKTLDHEIRVDEGSNFDQRTAAEIAKTVTEADLNTTKKKIAWEELLNASKREDTEAAKAAAIKLAAEWSTGEYTNWKTWTEIGKDAAGAILQLITK